MFANGKKTERMLLPRLLRTDIETSKEIRLYADFEHRSLTGELRLLIMLGLEQKRRELGEETVRLLRQLSSTAPEPFGPMSTDVNSRQPASARKFA